MSTKLPRVAGYEVVKALSKASWRVARQKGSHVTFLNKKSGFNR